MRSPAMRGGFSLTEVVIALGIVAFSVTAIMGLLTAGLNSGKSSLDDTVIAAAARQEISNLRRAYFPTIAPSAEVATTNNPLGAKDVLGNVYFDVNGKRMQDANGVDITNAATARSQGAIYQCTVTVRGDAYSLGPPAMTTGGNSLLNVEMDFQWPLLPSGSTAPNSARIFASVPKY
jgi:uncharacterized protein (TIGR02598 family)